MKKVVWERSKSPPSALVLLGLDYIVPAPLQSVPVLKLDADTGGSSSIGCFKVDIPIDNSTCASSGGIYPLLLLPLVLCISIYLYIIACSIYCATLFGKVVEGIDGESVVDGEDVQEDAGDDVVDTEEVKGELLTGVVDTVFIPDVCVPEKNVPKDESPIYSVDHLISLRDSFTQIPESKKIS